VIPDHEIKMAGFMYDALWMTIQEIADAMGLDYTSAHQRVHYSGVRVRDRSESYRERRRRRA
jgi:predicted transcriptional regulator